MKELKKFYDIKLKEYDTLHKAWVQSNGNLNGLYEAKKQIHDIGCIKIAFAAEALDKATKSEQHRNEELGKKKLAYERFLWDIEIYIKDTFGEELNGVKKVRGY